MKRVVLAVLFILCACSLLSACNTTKGFGKDLQKVGKKVEGAARRTGATDPQ